MRFRSMLLNLGIMLGSLVFCLFLLEISLHAQSHYLEFRYPIPENGSRLLIYDPILGWKYRPNFETFYVSKKDRFRIPIKTNSRGLRDKEYAYEKKKETPRILLLGDSVTAGFEVEKKDLIDVQLENLLSGYEVINGGVQGYGTDQSLLFLKNEGFKYQPDIIVFGAVNNDPMDNVTIHQGHKHFGKSYFVMNDRNQLELKGVPVPKFTAHDGWSTVLPEAAKYYGGEDIEEKNEIKKPSLFQNLKKDMGHLRLYQWLKFCVNNNENLQDLFIKIGLKEKAAPASIDEPLRQYENQMMSAILERMSKQAKLIGAQFLVYEFSNGAGVRPERPTDVETICQAHGIPYLNLSDRFFDLSKGKKKFCHIYDGHWNAKGHRFASELILESLKKERWV